MHTWQLCWNQERSIPVPHVREADTERRRPNAAGYEASSAQFGPHARYHIHRNPLMAHRRAHDLSTSGLFTKYLMRSPISHSCGSKEKALGCTSFFSEKSLIFFRKNLCAKPALASARTRRFLPRHSDSVNLGSSSNAVRSSTRTLPHRAQLAAAMVVTKVSLIPRGSAPRRASQCLFY